jgi:hypothetical protein
MVVTSKYSFRVLSESVIPLNPVQIPPKSVFQWFLFASRCLVPHFRAGAAHKGLSTPHQLSRLFWAAYWHSSHEVKFLPEPLNLRQEAKTEVQGNLAALSFLELRIR